MLKLVLDSGGCAKYLEHDSEIWHSDKHISRGMALPENSRARTPSPISPKSGCSPSQWCGEWLGLLLWYQKSQEGYYFCILHTFFLVELNVKGKIQSWCQCSCSRYPGAWRKHQFFQITLQRGGHPHKWASPSPKSDQPQKRTGLTLGIGVSSPAFWVLVPCQAQWTHSALSGIPSHL